MEKVGKVGVDREQKRAEVYQKDMLTTCPTAATVTQVIHCGKRLNVMSNRIPDADISGR